MVEYILEPFDYDFFRRGLLAALMVGALGGLIGVYVVLRGMSYIGHGLSHAVIGGAVIGFTLNLNFYAGACALGVFAALIINRITQNSKIKPDAAIGIVTTAIFALGVAIISKLRNFKQNFEAALFGNILGITEQDLMIIGLVTCITMVTMFFTYRTLLFSTFDQEAARIFGINTGMAQLLFSLLLTLVIIVSLNVTGVTMVAATLIAPAMTARMLTDSFSKMVVYSTLIGAITGVAGLYLSYIFNVASGATIVLFSALLFSLSLLVKPLHSR
ncbi:MAG: metal ABC transporter permease [Nitrosomonas sp.]|nr:metal ABC transporter permease [Nitrosomonas sp.]